MATLRDNRRDWDVRSRDDAQAIERGTLANFLSFRLMITPMFIGAFFLICLLINTGFGIYILFRSDLGWSRWIGIPVLLFGWIPIRVFCEVLILNFSIHGELVKLNDRVRTRDTLSSS